MSNCARNIVIAVGIIFFCSVSYGGVDKSGVKPQVVSLPDGPGSISGLGEAFEPRLNSGTTSYSIQLKVQPGRAGHASRIALAYNGGSGNSVFGLGWSLTIGYIQRRTSKGMPLYNDTDVLVTENGEELVPVETGIFRLENESSFSRFRKQGDGWVVDLKSGGTDVFGQAPESRISQGNKVFKWLLDESRDANGNQIFYQYIQDEESSQKYIKQILYNGHEIVFEYEDRPDQLSDFTSTLELKTAKRCKSISMITGTALVRKYTFTYDPDSYVSLLTSVTQVGRDGVTTLPPAAFTYTAFDPAGANPAIMSGSSDAGSPPFIILSSEPDATFNDMNGDSLPDLLVARAGEHYTYLNLGIGQDGKHRFSDMIEMGAASPGDALGDDGVSLADIDGDGRTDFIARYADDTYFLWRNKNRISWEPAINFDDNGSLPFDFEDPAVRLVDINNDTFIDVMYCNDGAGDTYSYFINDKGRGFNRVLVEQGLGNAMTFDQKPGMKLADMNGDGLQDILLLEDGFCQYWPLTGPGKWGDPVSMTNPPDSESHHEPGLYNDWPELKLLDLNGDGLTDVVYVPQGTDRVVYWLNRDSRSFAGPFSISGVPVSTGHSTVQAADMNGNGTTDLVWNYPEDSDIHRDQVWQYLDFSPIEKPYLLKTVTNGIGKTVTFFYGSTAAEYVRDRSGTPWPEGVPNPVNVLTGYHVEDGTGTVYQTGFTYHDGYYDSRKKEFRGFARVEKTEHGDVSAPDLISEYRFDTGKEIEALKGKMLFLETRNRSDETFFSEHNTWETRVLFDSIDSEERKVTFPFQTARVKTIIEKGSGTPVQLKWEYEYDGYGNMTRQYEQGRLDDGWDDERITTTDYSAAYPAGRSAWILDKVVTTTVSDENNQAASRKRHFYDGSSVPGEIIRGNLTKVQAWVSGETYIDSERNAYDTYGNIITMYDPLFGMAPGHKREIVYDQAYHTFPVEEIIHVNGSETLNMSATYDYGLGAVTSATEYNGHTTRYHYDLFGRLQAVQKPGRGYNTTEYSYILAHELPDGNLINWTETRTRDGSPDGFLKSRTYSDGLGRKIMTRSEGETQNQIVVSDTVTFNARKKPRKKYLPYFETGTLDYTDPSYHTGFTEHIYDALGREIQTWQPAGPEGRLFSEITYAPMSRLVRDEEQTKPASPQSGCGMRFVTDGLLNKDGEGRLREVYELVKLTDTGAPSGTISQWQTRYAYDLLDNLTGYTDAQNNRKTMVYDGMGRKIFMNDPDRGVMHYTYDDAGNLVRTADAKNQIIQYRYDGVNRLTGEFYGEDAQTPDVQYFYDKPHGPVFKGELWYSSGTLKIRDMLLHAAPFDEAFDLNTDGKIDVADAVVAEKTNVLDQFAAARNTKGFLSYVTDQSGEEHNSYDEHGRVEWVVKKVRKTGTDGFHSFYAETRYDDMDRVTSMVYPDGSYVRYTYNNRGLLESVPDIITGYDYNPAGQNSRLSLACGAVTNYTYDHRHRLNHLYTARTADSANLQNITYAYDGVSNIIGITDHRTAADYLTAAGELHIPADSAQKFNVTQSFLYDSLYRLIQAQNLSVYGTLQYRYDRIGNMVQKGADLLEPDSLMDLGEMVSGGSAGTAGRDGRQPGDPPGPHALTATEKGPNGPMIYLYDDNGNMVHNNGQTLLWDHKDRMAGMTDAAHTAAYVYDYTDTRKKKQVTKTADNTSRETLYIDKFSEIRDGKLIKYIYAGSNRVARATTADTEGMPIFADRYYLHDHLGSVNVTLTDSAMISEQIATYPYGRERQSMHTGQEVDTADYQFTGKELDEESDLMYFEARYYNPVVGRFVSVDPLYVNEPIQNKNKDNRYGDLVNPSFLNTMAYVNNGPLISIDKTGEGVFKILAALMIAESVGVFETIGSLIPIPKPADKIPTAIGKKVDKILGTDIQNTRMTSAEDFDSFIRHRVNNDTSGRFDTYTDEKNDFAFKDNFTGEIVELGAPEGDQIITWTSDNPSLETVYKSKETYFNDLKGILSTSELKNIDYRYDD